MSQTCCLWAPEAQASALYIRTDGIVTPCKPLTGWLGPRPHPMALPSGHPAAPPPRSSTTQNAYGESLFMAAITASVRWVSAT